MRQELTTDSVSRHIEASPDDLYDIISDVTRTPEMSPEIVSCTWIKGASGPPRLGPNSKQSTTPGRGPNWPNKPVIVTARIPAVNSHSRAQRHLPGPSSGATASTPKAPALE